MTNNNSYDFNDLFIFEMANNHQGSIKLGKSIIDMCSNLAKKHNLRAGIKFQFRQLDSFIHPNYIDADEPTHIKRFLSTKLSKKDFSLLKDYAVKKDLITICTPFDEESVEVIHKQGFEIIKIGSCSANDWPLLEKVSEYNLPVIISTGGLQINDIDKIVSFFDHKGVDFAIMHCVSLYPTPPELCELNQIENLRLRFPKITIGWSTHEDPKDTDIVMIAYAKGARMFEKHVGIIDQSNDKLNAYSASINELDNWILKYKKAKDACGSNTKIVRTKKELDSIYDLRRGVYAKSSIKKGTKISQNDIFLQCLILRINFSQVYGKKKLSQKKILV